MKIPPSYRLTKQIVLLLNTIESNRVAISKISLPIEIEDNLRRQSLLNSALFSARIEGNNLTPRDILNFSAFPRRGKSQTEVNNLRQANNFVLQKFRDNQRFAKKDILKFHQLAMKNVLNNESIGKFRTSHEGIFDVAGNLIYHAPPPSQIDSQINELINYLNGKKEKLIPIKAVIAHLILENIHPFADGSGRVGRLLQLAVLANSDYGMRGFAGTEEMIDKNKQLYYMAIEDSRSSDSTEFVELMLRFLAESSSMAIKQIEIRANNFDNLDFLAPRRKEIVQIIQDHKMVSLDFLHRRFINISVRLLSYDLKYLMDNGYISKIGKTRGALYTINNHVGH